MFGVIFTNPLPEKYKLVVQFVLASDKIARRFVKKSTRVEMDRNVSTEPANYSVVV